jgi:hypothetical protein
MMVNVWAAGQCCMQLRMFPTNLVGSLPFHRFGVAGFPAVQGKMFRASQIAGPCALWRSCCRGCTEGAWGV